MDEWLANLATERFTEILPVLRRTFAKFSHPERQKMIALAKRGNTKTTIVEQPARVIINQERVDKVLPTLKLLLDL